MGKFDRGLLCLRGMGWWPGWRRSWRYRSFGRSVYMHGGRSVYLRGGRLRSRCVSCCRRRRVGWSGRQGFGRAGYRHLCEAVCTCRRDRTSRRGDNLYIEYCGLRFKKGKTRHPVVKNKHQGKTKHNRCKTRQRHYKDLHFRFQPVALLSCSFPPDTSEHSLLLDI